MVRQYHTKPIYEDIEQQKIKPTDRNQSKRYNNYTHCRVWNREEPSRPDAEPLDELVKNPALPGKNAYGNNNTPSQRFARPREEIKRGEFGPNGHQVPMPMDYLTKMGTGMP